MEYPAESTRCDPDRHVDLKSVRVGAEFLRPLHPDLRKFVIRRALDDVADDFVHLQQAAETGVRGSRRVGIATALQTSVAQRSENELLISGQEVMQDWEAPLMKSMSRVAASHGGHILEVGFGMGISAGYLHDAGIETHTIIEANPEVADRAKEWARRQDTDTRVVVGRWQDAPSDIGPFEGILFDTYPADEHEYEQHVLQAPTFAEHFMPWAVEHLVPGGVLTYYTMEVDSLSRRHQRALLNHFESFHVSRIEGLRPPTDCTYWWANSMAVVGAIRGK